MEQEKAHTPPLQTDGVLIERIVTRLNGDPNGAPVLREHLDISRASSAVLLLLGNVPGDSGASPEPCIILNKRSEKVLQPGDLCCPGGGIDSRQDPFLSRFLFLPGLPLFRWPYGFQWKRHRPRQWKILRLLVATSVRESWEEMRLNPFSIRFLGPMDAQKLEMFEREIYPMVGWVCGRLRLKPNWEVEKIINIPLRHLLDPNRYARYRIEFKNGDKAGPSSYEDDYPCFLHPTDSGRERLWGATYKIVTRFLFQVFDFSPPDMQHLPVVHGVKDENYTNGRRRAA